MQHFGRLRHELSGGMPLEIAFLAMAQPLLSRGLSRAADSHARRVIVQPHLLFEGELVASLEAEVMAAGRRWPNQEWITTPPLADPPDQGSDGAELLVRVILDRYHEGLTDVVGPRRDG
jgi:sirohydrochlorin ferrochelatase